MAPGYRNSRRSGRGNIDHDVYEGLPVRQWRRDIVQVAPPPAQDGLDNAQDKWDVELPWGMPKDSHLLPQHAQDLLRAARSGRIYKRSLPVEEEPDDGDGIPGDKPEKKEETHKDTGYIARVWKQIPRHMEGPDVEYLAKRRKGLQSLSQTAATAAATMTRMTVKRTDAAGNTYQEVIVVPQGQTVDGEIVTQVPVVDPNAVAPLNPGLAQPARIISRKPPIPKGKRKGPGRGRKKKILAPTSAPGPSPTQLPTTETTVGEQPRPPSSRAEGVKTTVKRETRANEDTEMIDDSQHNSDEEGDDGEEGEEGEIVESDDDQDGSIDGHGETSTPTPAPESKNQSSRAGKSVPGGGKSAMKSVSIANPPVSEERDARSSPDFLGVPKATSVVRDEGSPLKTVQIIKNEEKQDTKGGESSEIAETPDIPTNQQPPPEPISAPTTTNDSAPSQVLGPKSPTQPQEIDQPDEMLLDTIEVSNPHEARDTNVKGEANGEGQRSREESEFPDLMGSLERHLDGNRSAGA